MKDKFHPSDKAERAVGSVRYAVIDAFTDTPYRGNPAAVLLLEEIKDTEWMQRVASEFNLSMTAFLRKRPPAPSRENGATMENCEEFDLRWFTPVTEVDLCGHATVAAAHFLFSSGLVNCNFILFHTRSGILTAAKVEGFKQEQSAKSFSRKITEEFAVELNFPQTAVLDCDSLEIPSLSSTLNGLAVNGVKKTASGDFLIELASGELVKDLQPQFDEIQKCSGRGIIVTGLASEQSGFDFISRFFCPKFGINEEKGAEDFLDRDISPSVGESFRQLCSCEDVEHLRTVDPVCGSAHCALAPYWATKLGKNNLVAYQASKRGGKLVLKVDQNHVLLWGEAVEVMSGVLTAE